MWLTSMRIHVGPVKNIVFSHYFESLSIVRCLLDVRLKTGLQSDIMQSCNWAEHNRKQRCCVCCEVRPSQC